MNKIQLLLLFFFSETGFATQALVSREVARDVPISNIWDMLSCTTQRSRSFYLLLVKEKAIKWYTFTNTSSNKHIRTGFVLVACFVSVACQLTLKEASDRALPVGVAHVQRTKKNLWTQWGNESCQQLDERIFKWCPQSSLHIRPQPVT